MVNYIKNYSCCFIGHRKLDLKFPKEHLYNLIKYLIINVGIRNFLFGSNSEFNDLCHQIVTSFKEIYPNIVRTNYPLSQNARVTPTGKLELEQTLKKLYKKIFYICDYDNFATATNSNGSFAYIKRNFFMIENANLVVVYLRDIKSKNNKTGQITNSGTKLAVDFAIKLKKDIIYI